MFFLFTDATSFSTFLIFIISFNKQVLLRNYFILNIYEYHNRLKNHRHICVIQYFSYQLKNLLKQYPHNAATIILESFALNLYSLTPLSV